MNDKTNEDKPILAQVTPQLMLRIAARGLPAPLLLDVDTSKALHHELGNALQGLEPPSGDATEH